MNPDDMTHNPKNAVALIRKMEPVMAAIGYHTALTGSVLYKGGSRKDTDVLLYPHDSDHTKTKEEILAALKPLGITLRFSDEIDNYPDNRVLRAFYEGRYIDLFFFVR